MKTQVFKDGRFISEFNCTGKKTKQYKSLKEIIERRKRATRDARLVQLF